MVLFRNQLRLIFLNIAHSVVAEELRPRLGVWRAGNFDGDRHNRLLDGPYALHAHSAAWNAILCRDLRSIWVDLNLEVGAALSLCCNVLVSL